MDIDDFVFHGKLGMVACCSCISSIVLSLDKILINSTGHTTIFLQVERTVTNSRDEQNKTAYREHEINVCLEKYLSVLIRRHHLLFNYKFNSTHTLRLLNPNASPESNKNSECLKYVKVNQKRLMSQGFCFRYK